MNTIGRVSSVVAGLVLLGGVSALVTAQSTTATAMHRNVAQTIVNDCADLHEGDLVWINGGTQDQQLLEDIAIEVRKLGAHPLISFSSERLERGMITEVPERFDAQEPAFAMKMAEMVDAVITVDFPERPDLMADIPVKRMANLAKAHEPVYDKMLSRGVVHVNLGNGMYPSFETARQYGIPERDLAELFWNGVNCDYDRLQASAAKVKSVFAAGKEVRITAPNGTDLRFRIEQRPVFASDGIISADDRYAGGPDCQVWLPAGEVYLAPVPGSATGTFVADDFYFEGRHIEKFKMTFDKGKLTKMTAAGDITELKAQYDAAPAGRDVFAALDVGINPEVRVPAGSRLLTWMGAGAISVGIGSNQWAGGDNNVPYGLFAHLTNGTLTVDGKPLVEQGRLTATGR